MSENASVWNGLEIIKLVISILTPVTIVFLGYIFNRMIRKLEQARWANQKVIEKRIVVFDKVAPKLNDLYCYFRYIGNWKELSPVDIIAAKRMLDKEMHVYSPLFSPRLMKLYGQFMDLCFRVYSGVGKDARLQTSINSPDGDRRAVFPGEWVDAWEDMFDDPGENAGDIQSERDAHQLRINEVYHQLTKTFSRELGVGLDDEESQ